MNIEVNETSKDQFDLVVDKKVLINLERSQVRWIISLLDAKINV